MRPSSETELRFESRAADLLVGARGPEERRHLRVDPDHVAVIPAVVRRRHLDEGAPKVRCHLSKKDAKFAQKLGQLQLFIAVFPQECMGQLASFGPT